MGVVVMYLSRELINAFVGNIQILLLAIFNSAENSHYAYTLCTGMIL